MPGGRCGLRGEQVGVPLTERERARGVPQPRPGPTKHAEQSDRVRRTASRVPGGRRQDQGVERGGDVRAAQTRRGDVGVDVPVGNGDRGIRVVWGPPREHLVEQDAGRVDVRTGITRAARDQFGCKVGHGAQQQPGRGRERRGLDCPSEAEIGDFDLPAVVRADRTTEVPSACRARASGWQAEQHVLGFDVAVDHAGQVRRGECPQHRLQDVESLGHRQRALLGKPAPQRRAAHQLHDQEHAVARQAAVGALVCDGDGIGSGQLGRRLGLTVEPGHEQGVPGEGRMHDLHRDGTVESRVDGRVDRGHAPGRQPVADLVAAVEQDPDQGIGDRRVHDRSLRSEYSWRRPQNPPSCACRGSAHVLNRAGIRRRSSCRGAPRLAGSP